MSGLDVKGVLSAHRSYVQEVDDERTTKHSVFWTARCTCGELLERGQFDEAHRAHVAAVLREQIDGALAEARQGALLDAACDVFRASPFSAGSPVYRAELGDWLRDRAAHLSDTERAELGENAAFYEEHYSDWAVHALPLMVYVPTAKDRSPEDAMALVQEILNEAAFDIRVVALSDTERAGDAE